MEVRWFSELPLQGKVPRNFRNMRTEFAWFVAQDSSHTNLFNLPQLPDQSIDVGIIIIPKKVEPFLSMDIVGHLKRVCKKYAFMQEGPSWYFQSLPLQQSFWFFNIMLNADFVLAHNDTDKEYYEGLLGKPVFINPTLMIEDSIKSLPSVDRKGTMLGGNLVRWYGGFNSLIVAQEAGDNIQAPQMGRMDKAELGIQEIKHLPYLEWVDWIKELNKVKYAVHLNPNTIGGTFNLNCAYLGIPCIGNEEANTQKLCFPELSVRANDIGKARKLMKRLVEDQSFYSYISRQAKENYIKYFSEDVYKLSWNEIINNL
jgi:hypothetical protein